MKIICESCEHRYKCEAVPYSVECDENYKAKENNKE